MPPPKVVAWDVNETLISLAGLEPLLPDGAMPLWFARILRDGFAHAATGQARSFAELAATHLRGVVDDPDAVLTAFRQLDAYPDARPALERLRDAGVRSVTLTNGAKAVTEALMAHNDLADLFERYLSVDDVGVWKPRPEPYQHAAKVCGVDPADVALVAVHSWDIHGAKSAGLATGWCSRLEGSFVDGFAEPDVRGDDLVSVVESLLAR
ncbi:MAG: HAD-IA family hydrolase [Egibacteraceae bacterium]